MTHEVLKTIFAVGETIGVEFKRCGNGIDDSTYETVCSFLNRFGGDIFLGVENDGTVRGIPEKSVPGLIKNFISMVSNPKLLEPTMYLVPTLVVYEGKHIIHIRIPSSSEVHRYKNVVYDRVDDADVKVKSTGQIAALYIRKQNIYTEKRVYPYVGESDLRLDLMPLVRRLALNRDVNHPWKEMPDTEIFRSAGLIGKDSDTGKEGFNLAAIMLLGRDEVIRDVCPAYCTDAIMRKVNTERYDDRLVVETNLIKSYDLLAKFAEKHTLDKFHLEGVMRISLRGIIVREMLVNMLMHREFTSSFRARFIIERDKMFTENANRAESTGLISPDNINPTPKNPIIASFMRNIWMADQLGSGTRRLHRYVPLYSNKQPQMIEGDIFRIIVPLDDDYSFDARIGNENKAQFKAQNKAQNADQDCALNCTSILDYLCENPNATQKDIAKAIGKSRTTVQSAVKELQHKGLLERDGAKKNGRWIVAP